jgi:organic hydroperoxide reductase OsmC/OhrA
MNGQHTYNLTISWTGNTGSGTSHYTAYERSHTILVNHKAPILGSSDPAFRGDKTKHNPEELLLASIASCHMLWYLHLCAVAGIRVTDYTDSASGIMIETPNGGGRFAEVTLNPIVTLADVSMSEKANALHKEANAMCFIANSLNFPVHHKPQVVVSCQNADCGVCQRTTKKD